MCSTIRWYGVLGSEGLLLEASCNLYGRSHAYSMAAQHSLHGLWSGSQAASKWGHVLEVCCEPLLDACCAGEGITEEPDGVCARGSHSRLRRVLRALPPPRLCKLSLQCIHNQSSLQVLSLRDIIRRLHYTLFSCLAKLSLCLSMVRVTSRVVQLRLTGNTVHRKYAVKWTVISYGLENGHCNTVEPIYLTDGRKPAFTVGENVF